MEPSTASTASTAWPTEEPTTEPWKPPTTWVPLTQTSTAPEITTANPWLRQCDAGYTKGQNVNGDLICLPDSGSLLVTECNDPTTGIIRITGKIFKGYEPTQPPGFDSDPSNNEWWTRTFELDDPAVSPWDEKNKKDPEYFYLHANARMHEGGNIGGEIVYVETGMNYQFICKFPMDDQIVTDGVQVSGHDSDIQISSVGSGKLNYNIKLDAETVRFIDILG